MSDLAPVTAASLLIDGKIYSQTNLMGESEPNLHPFVREFFDNLPVEQREPFMGYCAESALISDQLWGIEQESGGGHLLSTEEVAAHFAGSVLVARKIRPGNDPEHGQPAQICRSCSALLQHLGIEVMEQ